MRSAATAPAAGYRRRNRNRLLLVLFAAAVFGSAFWSDLTIGSSGMSAADALRALAAGPGADGLHAVVVWGIRLPMTLMCVCAGGALGLAGLLLQTITNNPLASPYTFGITAGAGFGAAVSVTTGFAVAGQLWLGTSVLAFVFALLVSLAIFYLGKVRGMSATTLILTGIVMNFLFTALQQYLQYLAPPEIAQIIAGWTFGNLTRATWTSVFVCGAVIVLAGAPLLRQAWRLTAIAAGEERAESLGVNVESTRFAVFVISALLTSAAAAFIGTIAFVGLIAPHCARLLAGDDQRFLQPLSVLFGGTLLLLASIVSKLLSTGSMLPVGIITSFVGVPFLFLLLMGRRGNRA